MIGLSGKVSGQLDKRAVMTVESKDSILLAYRSYWSVLKRDFQRTVGWPRKSRHISHINSPNHKSIARHLSTPHHGKSRKIWCRRTALLGRYRPKNKHVRQYQYMGYHVNTAQEKLDSSCAVCTHRPEKTEAKDDSHVQRDICGLKSGRHLEALCVAPGQSEERRKLCKCRWSKRAAG